MGATGKVINSLRKHGVATVLLRILLLVKYQIMLAEDYYFDFKYKTDTNKKAALEDLEILSANSLHGFKYQATPIKPLKRIFQKINGVLDEKVLVDFGCGKGRVLMIASLFNYREVRGVEFSRELCRIATENCAKFARSIQANTIFKVIESDVTGYQIKPDENIFFFYNPFDSIVLRKVIGNIIRSIETNPRKVFLIYYNPRIRDVIEEREIFTKYHAAKKIAIYTNI